MGTKVGYLGQWDYYVGGNEETSLMPISTSNHTRYYWNPYYGVNYTGYYTIDQPTLQLDPYEYPSSITFSEYSEYIPEPNGQRRGTWKDNNPDKPEPAHTTTFTLGLYGGEPGILPGSVYNFLTYSLGHYGEKRFEETWNIPVDNGKQMAGQKMNFRLANRGTQVHGYFKVTIETDYIYTRCGDASNVSGPSIVNGNFELKWTAGTNGTNNAVNGYIVEYRDRTSSGTWGSWTGSTTVATNKLTVSPNPTQGAYRQFRVKTTGAAGSSWYAANWAESNEIRTNINPNTPTNCSITPTIYETGKVTMAWTKSVKTTSDIVQYYIGYRTKSAGGSWTGWAADVAIGNVAQFQTEPSLSRGTQVQYRIRAIDTLGSYSNYVEFSVVTKNTQPGVPGSLTVSTTLWESGNITLTWTAATAGTSPIDHYVIQVAVFNKSTNSFGSYTDVKNVTTLTTTVAPPSFDRGNKINYRIITVDTLGVTSAAWTYSAEIKRNSLPVAPASLSVSPAVYESGNITLTWTAGTDADGNLSGYEIGYSISSNGSTWGNWTVLANVGGILTYNHAPSTSVLPGGSYIKYRIRSKDNLNVYSSSYRESSAVMKNSPSSAPVIVVPAVANAVIDSLTPALKINYANDPDGQSQRLRIQAIKDGTTRWNTEIVVGKNAGTAVVRMGLPENGVYEIHAWIYDGFIDSEIATCTINASAAAWNRQITTGTVIANTNISHQADITEIIEKANHVRAYYGLEAFEETGNGYFARWKPIMDDIAAKLLEAYAVVGETKAWEGASIYPSAATVNAVRQLIAGA